jgi:hypothetical protein
MLDMNNIKFKERRDGSPYRAVSLTSECSTQTHLECVGAMAAYGRITHITVIISCKNKSFNKY